MAKKNYWQLAQTAGKSANQIYTVLAVLAFALLAYAMITSAANGNSSDADVQQAATTAGCTYTADKDLLKPDTTALKTIELIAVIDVNTDLTKTSQGKATFPPINQPKFITAKEAALCLQPDDQVLALTYNGVTKIYPQKILAYHPVINDQIVDLPLAVTFCPLCAHYQVFVREYRNEQLQFAAAGMLYKNNDVLYDTKTDSLWTQFEGKAVVGNFTGAELTTQPFQLLQFKHAKVRYPNAQYLSFDTGYRRDYQTDPTISFASSPDLAAKVTNSNPELPLRELILGFEVADKHYALPLSKLTTATEVSFQIAGQAGVVRKTANGYEVEFAGTKQTPRQSYWYVWYDFYPETKLI